MADDSESVILTPSEAEKNPVLDEMWRRGIRKRDEILGQDFFSRLREFWAFRQGVTSTSRTPTFRPSIQFSDLQWMAVQEAGDLTDNSPIPIITGSDGQQRRDHEMALRGQWYVGDYNLRFYMGALEAILCGTGWLMQMFDPAGRNGRGDTVLSLCDSESVVVDDGCTNFRNWQYVVYRSRLSLDEIRRSFPKNASRLPKFPSAAMANVPKLGTSQSDSPDYVRMPPGPMQQQSIGPIGSGNNTRVLEYFLFKDDGMRTAQDIEGNEPDALLLEPKEVPRYPHGRLIIRCDKVHLYDGPNPYKKFNFIPIQVHPNRNTSFWCPPPIRYVIQLQDIAQTLTRQNVENTVRLNNGLVLINEAAGLSADSVMGLPGERVLVKSPDGVDKAIKILTPPQFGGEMWAVPDKLLDKMKKDFGFNDTRQGKPGQGNQSSNLFDSSLSAASGLTKVRSRLMQPSVKLALEMVYETMLTYQNDTMFPLPNERTGALEFKKWAGVDPEEYDINDWELLVDPASIKAMSSTVARQMAIVLRQQGLLPVKDTLVWLGVPDANRIADDVQQEMQQQLLAKESSRGAPRRR